MIFRRLRLSQSDTTELPQQQNVAMDTVSMLPRLPYNLYWRRKISKKMVGEHGTDANQICKCCYTVYYGLGWSMKSIF